MDIILDRWFWNKVDIKWKKKSQEINSIYYWSKCKSWNKLLEENSGKTLCDFRVGKDFVDRTQHLWKRKILWNSSKLKTLLPSDTLENEKACHRLGEIICNNISD